MGLNQRWNTLRNQRETQNNIEKTKDLAKLQGFIPDTATVLKLTLKSIFFSFGQQESPYHPQTAQDL